MAALGWRRCEVVNMSVTARRTGGRARASSFPQLPGEGDASESNKTREGPVGRNKRIRAERAGRREMELVDGRTKMAADGGGLR